jgi:dTDP-4-dehydrorhamnose 3,5-epimerase
MIFMETKLHGAYKIELERHQDERGFFARAWCQHEWMTKGLNPRLVQCNVSFNKQRGTLRGMHWQTAPYAEAKLVRCTMGAMYDVIIDLRPESSTYRQYDAFILTPEDGIMLYVPEGFAHGFLTLVDHTEVFYQMSEFYHPENQAGVRWNDPAFGIHWIEEVRVVSDRDMHYPDYYGSRKAS